MLQRNLLPLSTFIFWSWWTLNAVVSYPQTYLVDSACNPYHKYVVSNFSIFDDNLNATFQDLREQISNQNKHFATAQQANGANPVSALFQCRNYLSVTDCVACFAVAAAQIRNCSAGADGARVIYDGCFLRYETSSFYDQTTESFNTAYCGNQTTTKAPSFTAVVQQVLMNLEIVTPRIPGFFAATKTQMPNGPTIYAFAQCINTVTQSGCLDCLKVGYNNMQVCLPNSDGRAVDAGCFMRYSTTSFFTGNQTIDVTPFLEQGSSKKGAIIGGVVGSVSLILILLALFAWIKLPKRPKRVTKGDILGKTELKGPVNYSYKDLKSATKSFSIENKLGEGGFGVVYKGTLKNGKVVAVKKLALRHSKRMEEDFESEVKLISNVHHRNLVRLLGCCSKGHERILVYEYIKNNSLDRFLFGTYIN